MFFWVGGCRWRVLQCTSTSQGRLCWLLLELPSLINCFLPSFNLMWKENTAWNLFDAVNTNWCVHIPRGTSRKIGWECTVCFPIGDFLYLTKNLIPCIIIVVTGTVTLMVLSIMMKKYLLITNMPNSILGSNNPSPFMKKVDQNRYPIYD